MFLRHKWNAIVCLLVPLNTRYKRKLLRIFDENLSPGSHIITAYMAHI